MHHSRLSLSLAHSRFFEHYSTCTFSPCACVGVGAMHKWLCDPFSPHRMNSSRCIAYRISHIAYPQHRNRMKYCGLSSEHALCMYTYIPASARVFVCVAVVYIPQADCMYVLYIYAWCTCDARIFRTLWPRVGLRSCHILLINAVARVRAFPKLCVRARACIGPAAEAPMFACIFFVFFSRFFLYYVQNLRWCQWTNQYFFSFSRSGSLALACVFARALLYVFIRCSLFEFADFFIRIFMIFISGTTHIFRPKRSAHRE